MSERIVIPSQFYNNELDGRKHLSLRQTEQKTVKEFMEKNGGTSPENVCNLLKEGGLALFWQTYTKLPITKEVFTTYLKTKAVNSGLIGEKVDSENPEEHISVDRFNMGYRAEEYMLGKLELDAEMANQMIAWGSWNILENYLSSRMEVGGGQSSVEKLPIKILTLENYKYFITNLEPGLVAELGAKNILDLLAEPIDPAAFKLTIEVVDAARKGKEYNYIQSGGSVRMLLNAGKLNQYLSADSIYGIESLIIEMLGPLKLKEYKPDIADETIFTALLNDPLCCEQHNFGEMKYGGGKSLQEKEVVLEKCFQLVFKSDTANRMTMLALLKKVSRYLSTRHPVLQFLEDNDLSEKIRPDLLKFIIDTYGLNSNTKTNDRLDNLFQKMNSMKAVLWNDLDREDFDPSTLMNDKFKIAVLDSMLLVGDENFAQPTSSVIQRFINSKRVPLDTRNYKPIHVELTKVVRGVRQKQDDTEKNARKEFSYMSQMLFAKGASSLANDGGKTKIDRRVALKVQLQTTEVDFKNAKSTRPKETIYDTYSPRLTQIENSVFEEEDKVLLRAMLYGTTKLSNNLLSVFTEMYEQTTGANVRDMLSDLHHLNYSNAVKLRNFLLHSLGQETIQKYFSNKYSTKFSPKQFKNTFEGKIIRSWLHYNLGCGAINQYLNQETAVKTDQKISISFEPTRSFVADCYGAISDACWAPAEYSITAEFPNVTIVKHIKKQSRGERKHSGAHVLCETKIDKDDSSALLIIGINPLENLSREVDPMEFVISVFQHAWDVAKSKGIENLVVCLDGIRKAATNRDVVWSALETVREKYNLTQMQLAPVDNLPKGLKHNLNGSDIAGACYSLRPLVESGIIK